MVGTIALGHHGALPPALLHTTISQHAVRQVYVVKTREYCRFYDLFAVLRHHALLTCRAYVFVGCISGQCWEYHTLSGQRWGYDALSCTKSMLLSAPESMMLSACAESMKVSALPVESMILSAPFDPVIMLTVAWQVATKKTTIGNTDDRHFTTWFNSASTTVPISLPLKMAKFCHTSNRLLVGRQCCRALWRL